MYLDQKSFGEPQGRQLLEEFATWLESKDPGEQYVWTDPYICACGQFAHDIGRFDAWRDHPYDSANPWRQLNELAGHGIVDDNYGTFGKLREVVSQELLK